MKPLNTDYKNLLEKIARKVQDILDRKISDDRVIKIKNLRVFRTYTFGYYVEIFGFKRIAGRGKIELWLDLWTNIRRPVLCICFWSSDLSKIEKITKSCFENHSDDHPNKVKYFSNGQAVLQQPLANKYFHKYLIEPYSTKYLSYYFFNEIKVGKPISKTFIGTICIKTEWLIRSTASALEITSKSEKDYSVIENREKVAEHKKRDRSRKLAEMVKRRDAFTCRVCGFNFSDTYGEIGRGIAEAHHIISLSRLKKKVRTTPEDLITVCANCHRVLHKMNGNGDDYKKLGKLVKKHMPNMQHAALRYGGATNKKSMN